MSPKSDASQVKFNLLFKNHPLPMWIYDIQSLAFLKVNDAAVKYTATHVKNSLHLL
ncbi:MAG: hypothetical protein IPH11_11745 [Ignavibacteriales bacterium]|nr:hypothetical protein [Ignavibacteriales bacterium]